jgi:glycosyltransferase involved in cell wall biosynthesis
MVKSYLDEDKIIHIPTFVIRSEKYNPHLGNYCLIVGRVEENKGILTAIKAIENTKYKLKIVGKSSTGYEEVLKDYIAKNKVTNVELLGEKFGKKLRQIYVNSRFVIIPAEWYENMPNVALESMVYSKPIISSDLGSLKEIIIDGYNGLLFKPRDVQMLREKIKLLFENDSLCKKMGKKSYQEAIEKYSPEAHYKKLISVFNRAIKKGESQSSSVDNKKSVKTRY